MATHAPRGAQCSHVAGAERRLDANLAPIIRIGQLLDRPALLSTGVGRFAIDGEKWMTSVRPLALVDAHPFLQLQGDIVELGPVL